MEEEIQKQETIIADEALSELENNEKDSNDDSEELESPYGSQTNTQNPESNEENEDVSGSIKVLVSTVDKELEDETADKDIVSAPMDKIQTTEVILKPPLNESQPSNRTSILNPYQDTQQMYPQKSERRLPVQRTRHISCTFIIIAILLCLVSISYLIGGAWLFLYLEELQELSYINEIAKLKNDTAILLATELRQVKAHEAIWSQYVFKHLDIYEDALLRSTGLGYWRQDHSDGKQRWAYPNTMFYSLSLMTTTGYGSMTPRSKWGRTATVCYSLFGIPLTISWIICMGRFLAFYWSWMFDNICCRFCCHSTDGKTVTKPKNLSNKITRRRSNAIGPLKEPIQPRVASAMKNADLELQRDIYRADSNLQNNPTREKSNQVYETNNNYFVAKYLEDLSENFSNIDDQLSSLDHVVSIVFAVIFFLVYFVFGSALFSAIEGFVVTDILYFNYLMFASVGPGSYELQDDIAENKIKGNLYYIIYLIFGYLILSMICNLIYMHFHPTSRHYRTLRSRKT
ncbi:ion_trans_2 domain-containing protein [Nephila pilipes]|uniref:Ion_trans_2 domain-containing protein n=1 Tax=Nephila pilipes TaxID=299642 RepID=A0A8X6QJB0_NEPPI|nr:ion_trans_2 domain-containing protein [Nephila pilipes]